MIISTPRHLWILINYIKYVYCRLGPAINGNRVLDVCLALRGLEHVADLKVRLSLALLVKIRWQSFLESVDIRLA